MEQGSESYEPLCLFKAIVKTFILDVSILIWDIFSPKMHLMHLISSHVSQKQLTSQKTSNFLVRLCLQFAKYVMNHETTSTAFMTLPPSPYALHSPPVRLKSACAVGWLPELDTYISCLLSALLCCQTAVIKLILSWLASILWQICEPWHIGKVLCTSESCLGNHQRRM